MHVQLRHVAHVAAFALALGPLAAIAIAAPPPTAVDDTYQTDEDAQLDVVVLDGLLANDGAPADGNEFCVESVDESGLHGTLDWNRDGSFAYTPSANYHGTGADNSFTYTMDEVAVDATCAGNQSSTATVEITVNSVNDAPTAVADSFFALKNTTLNISAPGVLGNDTDIDGDSLTAQKTVNPLHGVVVLAADGSFSYTPSTGFTGSDLFFYRANDGQASSIERKVTITVSAIPALPTPTPVPTPTPLPTPAETLTPILTPTPETTPEPGASPTPFVPPTPQLSGVPSPAASAAATLAPGQTAQPSETSGGGFSSPIVLLLGVTLLALIFGIAAAMYGPGWLEARRNRNG